MFKYTKRAFKDDSDEDDGSDDDNFGTSKDAGKSKLTKKRNAPKNNVPGPKRKDILSIDNSDDEGSDDCVATEKVLVAKNVVNQLLARGNEENNIEQGISAIDDDENIRAARELLSQIGSAKLKLTDIDEDVKILPVNTSTLVLPTVRIRSAAEKAQTCATTDDVSAESLLDSLFTSSSSSSSSVEAPPTDAGGPRIRIKTRLNGKHEGRFKIAINYKFEKLRHGLAKIYDIATSLIVMKFDGDSIDDDQTPEEIDMDDDDMIDVTIPKEKYDAAIAASLTATSSDTTSKISINQSRKGSRK